jgi:hypothetical protein
VGVASNGTLAVVLSDTPHASANYEPSVSANYELSGAQMEFLLPTSGFEVTGAALKLGAIGAGTVQFTTEQLSDGVKS